MSIDVPGKASCAAGELLARCGQANRPNSMSLNWPPGLACQDWGPAGYVIAAGYVANGREAANQGKCSPIISRTAARSAAPRKMSVSRNRRPRDVLGADAGDRRGQTLRPIVVGGLAELSAALVPLGDVR